VLRSTVCTFRIILETLLFKADKGGSTCHESGRRQLSTEPYVRPLSWHDVTTAGHHVKIQKNWVPAFSDEGLWKRSKRQRFLVLFWLCNINLFSNTEFQPNETISWKGLRVVFQAIYQITSSLDWPTCRLPSQSPPYYDVCDRYPGVVGDRTTVYLKCEASYDWMNFCKIEVYVGRE